MEDKEVVSSIWASLLQVIFNQWFILVQSVALVANL